MGNSLKLKFLVLILILTANVASAQNNKVCGVVVDSYDNSPIPSVNVVEIGQQEGVTSDSDGHFQIFLSDNSFGLEISHVGYTPIVLNITNISSLDTIRLTQDYIELEDVTIIGQIATERKTPIAISNITYKDINDKLGCQEFPELLKSTPSIHVNKQGGDWGESEIYMRGFDNSNITVMVNGIPMNDMEDQSVYWSNLTELNDITSYLQAQRGIGANKLSVSSIAGSVNIVTNGIESKKGGYGYYSMGNSGYKKISFSISTGLMKNNWSVTILGSFSDGDGHVQGTEFKAHSYYLNISKIINDKNIIKVSFFGAPQSHYRRSYALKENEWKNVRKYATNGMHWSSYNPTYGFGLNGVRKASDYNSSHKPLATINHIWQMNDKMNLSTSLYGSIGIGYGYVGVANSDEYSSESWFGSYDGVLNNEFRCSDGTFDYAKIQGINAESTNGSQLIMTKQKNSNKTLGLTSTFTDNISDNFDVYVGVDLRNYQAGHTYEISDLYSGEYFVDPSRLNVSVDNNINANDSSWVYQKLGVGDVVQRDYDSHVVQEGLFGQIEYSKNKFCAFVSTAVNHTTYWRVDRLYYDRNNSRSDNIGFWGGNVKTGANYNINKENNVYINVGYLSRAPKFKNGAFMSANTSHAINKDVRNEKMVSAEIGYGYISRIFNLNANAYITEWIDKSMVKKGKMPNKTQYLINMTGVNARHWGIELNAAIYPIKWLDILAMFSVGDWRWDGDGVLGYVYDTYGNALNSDGEITSVGSSDHAWAKINTKGIHVGGSAQTVASIEVMFKPFEGIRFGSNCNYYGRNYAYYTFSGSNLAIGNEVNVKEPWQIPSFTTIDLRASYCFNIGKCPATISAQINNLFDNHYIEKAWEPNNVSSQVVDSNHDDVYFFYSVGRYGNVRLKIGF